MHGCKDGALPCRAPTVIGQAVHDPLLNTTASALAVLRV